MKKSYEIIGSQVDFKKMTSLTSHIISWLPLHRFSQWKVDALTLTTGEGTWPLPDNLKCSPMFEVANALGQHAARLVHAWHQACSHSVKKPEKNVPRCLSLGNCHGNDLRFAYFSTENQLHQHLGISLASDHFSHLSDLQSFNFWKTNGFTCTHTFIIHRPWYWSFGYSIDGCGIVMAGKGTGAFKGLCNKKYWQR